MHITIIVTIITIIIIITIITIITIIITIIVQICRALRRCSSLVCSFGTALSIMSKLQGGGARFRV